MPLPVDFVLFWLKRMILHQEHHPNQQNSFMEELDTLSRCLLWQLILWRKDGKNLCLLRKQLGNEDSWYVTLTIWMKRFLLSFHAQTLFRAFTTTLDLSFTTRSIGFGVLKELLILTFLTSWINLISEELSLLSLKNTQEELYMKMDVSMMLEWF